MAVLFTIDQYCFEWLKNTNYAKTLLNKWSQLGVITRGEQLMQSKICETIRSMRTLCPASDGKLWRWILLVLPHMAQFQ